MNTLANKTALVTGASRGMGRAAALALAAAGARVVVHYGRNADEAKAVVDQIRAAGGRADAIGADLAATDGAHRLAAQVRNLIGEKLDIVVANAGISKSAPIEDVTVKDFDDLFAVNVRAPYFLVQQLLPMLGEGSSVIGGVSAAGDLRQQFPPFGGVGSEKRFAQSGWLRRRRGCGRPVRYGRIGHWR